MALIPKGIVISENLQRAVLRTALACIAMCMVTFLPQGRVAAQSAAGPLPAAAPSDQPRQAPAAQSNSPAGKPNLGGTWKLNVDQSDNPMQKMREAQQESGDQPGGGRRGGGGGFGGGGYGRGGYGRNGGGQGGANGRRGGMQGMAQLVIEQTPTSVKVTESTGRVIALYHANPEQSGSSSAPANGDANVPAAQWQDNKLVTTVEMPNGGTTSRSFEISPDTKQLIVTTKMETKRLKEPLAIRQVYDPVTVSTGGN